MAQKPEYKDLLDAGVHFGHLTRKWDPRMAPYIFMERNGIHIIDLNKTLASMEDAADVIREHIRQGRRILFVATKKQAKEIVAQEAERLKMPFVTERWLGGMLTNFVTIRKSLRKMGTLDKKLKDDHLDLNKKEKLVVGREKAKLDRVLGGIAEMKNLPAALFVVDVRKEHIAIAEAKRLGIPVIGIVDTNSNPTQIDYPIPANDDAYKSIALITKYLAQAIEEGLQERRREKDDARLKEDEDGRIAEDNGAAPVAAAATATTTTESPATDEATKESAE